MKVISSDEGMYWEICDIGVDLFGNNQHLARISAKDIDRIATILRYRRDIAALELKVQKEADGTADIPGF